MASVISDDVWNALQAFHDSPDDITSGALHAALEEEYGPPPVPDCDWCGRAEDSEEQEPWGPLVDFTVTVAEGEEGFAHKRMLACFECMAEVSTDLIEIGFGVHRHGGTNYLEPTDCPGHAQFGACPISDDGGWLG